MPFIHVAVGVIQNIAGEICIAKRPAGKHMGGFWEFPGGKVEAGENVLDALKRELWEELSIKIQNTRELIKIDFEYPDKTVLLDVHLVKDFSGEVVGREQQTVIWVAPQELEQYRFPQANTPIIQVVQRLD